MTVSSIAYVADFRPMGIALLVLVILFMIGASSAAYFRRFPLPTDPLEKLKLIAKDRVGWSAQAIIFPVVYAGTTIVFGWMAAQLSLTWPRWLAIGATLLFAVGFLLWLPISIDRLRLASDASELIENYDPAAPPDLMAVSTFWAHTYCVLAAIALMGAALALGSVLPTLGWIVAGIAVASALIAAFVWHDWPPFISYVWLLIMAIGLIWTG